MEAPSTGALPPAPALELETGSVSPLVGRDGVRAWRELPADLLPLVDAALEESELWLLRNDEADFRSGLLDVFFQLVSFRRTAERYDGRYRTLLFPGRHPDLKLFCVDPALELREASQRAKSAVFFSATLSPLDYYRELLGGEAKARTLQLPSPFPPERLLVLVQDRVRTQYHSREATLWQVAQAIGTLVEQRRGNYLVYLPSYQYLESLQHQFRHDYPMISVRAQRPGMSESDRADFLSAFASDLKDTQVGFAVLGGIFGEGVDLVGDRLIGAAIVGVGLPQLCAERDLIRDYFQEKMGSGFDYAYTFPGMNRVLQATGRVIRSESDRGVVLLIDTRYGERRYAGLLPSHWRPSRARHASQLSESVERFWRSPA
ncbi:MAG: ATP-dependent DNA helicase [Verrucomicrobiota bacterium]